VLATVKGDVHDIGKNLVEIIFKNNGYDVVNLGIKVRGGVDQGIRTHKPDAIGLSGLLVKSAQQMVITASDLKDAGIMVPLLVEARRFPRNSRKRRSHQVMEGGVLCKDAMRVCV